MTSGDRILIYSAYDISLLNFELEKFKLEIIQNPSIASNFVDWDMKIFAYKYPIVFISKFISDLEENVYPENSHYYSECLINFANQDSRIKTFDLDTQDKWKELKHVFFRLTLQTSDVVVYTDKLSEKKFFSRVPRNIDREIWD
jgi:hypothetical protein